jgi:hypothetical protein
VVGLLVVDEVVRGAADRVGLFVVPLGRAPGWRDAPARDEEPDVELAGLEDVGEDECVTGLEDVAEEVGLGRA